MNIKQNIMSILLVANYWTGVDQAIIIVIIFKNIKSHALIKKYLFTYNKIIRIYVINQWSSQSF